MASHRIPFETLSAERSRLLAENDRLRQQLRERYRDADLAGTSQAVRRVRELVDQVAPSEHSVLLCGEAGVGKTRTARAIHRTSTRSAGPFIVVRCDAMPDAEVDAQLFGAGAGAASSAGTTPVGCVARAAGGTLVFDEVASLGPLGQRRLLELARRGRAAAAPAGPAAADVRIVATSVASLDELVRRLDGLLADHLAELTIRVPPLRERRIDLPVLADLFVEQCAREHVRGVSRLSDRATDMLMNYDWPGNVAELRQTIDRAVVLTTGHIIHHHHLPPVIQGVGGGGASPLLGLSEALDAYEKELLEDALRRAHGVRSQAARLLMTSERVFSYRLRKHDIDSRRFKPA
jgi:Nif-specific regulatory protein